QIASAPIGADVQIVHHAFYVIGAHHYHGLIGLVVFRAGESVGGYELQTMRKTTLEFKRETVVTRVRRALEQAHTRKPGNRTRRWMTQYSKRLTGRIGQRGWHWHAKVDVPRARKMNAAKIQIGNRQAEVTNQLPLKTQASLVHVRLRIVF